MKRKIANFLYWLIVFLLLLAPVLLIMKFNTKDYFDIQIPSFGIAAILFVFLFLEFKYLRPQIQNLFERGRRNLITNVDDLFNVPLEPAIEEGQKDFRDGLFDRLVGGFASKFGMRSAHCFLFDKTKKKFMTAYSFGEKILDEELFLNSPLIKILSRTPGIVYKAALKYPRESNERRIMLDFFSQNKLEAIMPCMNPENQIIGLIALGPLSGNKDYSFPLLSALELYRIQFQHKLSNALMLEEVRAHQVDTHDQMVIRNVKNKVIPNAMTQINGYRINSLYVDNSQFGVSYFDSVLIEHGRAALFMADSLYSGVDSAIISLELYSVLHSSLKLFDSPGKVFDIMNWVLASSKFDNKYAPALCIMLTSSGELSYSNATFNPLLLYDPEENTITEYGSNGSPLGVDKNSKYESAVVTLKPGAVGVLFSNGLASAINADGKAFSIEQVKGILRTGARKSAPMELTRIINAEVTDFIKEQNQILDMSAIIFRFQ
jgi:serine phosphatase RsbU (regulator of sigma subunit)